MNALMALDSSLRDLDMRERVSQGIHTARDEKFSQDASRWPRTFAKSWRKWEHSSSYTDSLGPLLCGSLLVVSILGQVLLTYEVQLARSRNIGRCVPVKLWVGPHMVIAGA